MASTRKLKKNSVGTTIAAPGIVAADTSAPVTDCSRFYDKDGVLITRGITISPDNANTTLTEEITITGCSATSGPGNITGMTRGVNADGTIGAAHDWPAGTNIAVTFSTGIYEQFLALPNRNAIINGDCRVNQRGTAYTLVKDAYCWDSSDLYGPDRHEGMATGTAVSAGTFGQSTASLAGSSGYGFRFSGVTLTGTGIIYQRGRIEAKDAARFKNGIASFSCKIYHDVGSAKNFTVYIRKANSADNFAAVTAIGNSGAVSIPNTTDTALKYENISMGDCSNGIEYEIKGEVGAITTKNIYISEIQLEPGPVSTAFEFCGYTVECLRCLRYYYRLVVGSSGKVFGLGYVSPSANYCRIPAALPIEMRASPTFSNSGASDFTWDGPTAFVPDEFIMSVGSAQVVLLQVKRTAGGLTTYNAGSLSGNSSTSFVAFSSEL